jgi:hypothetical protein
LRRIFGPTKEKDGTWRVKTNEELDSLIKQHNIINQIRAQRLSWFGHVQRMSDDRMVKKVYKWKPIVQDYKKDLIADGMIMLNKTSVK